jgi:hypothetical protein
MTWQGMEMACHAIIWQGMEMLWNGHTWKWHGESNGMAMTCHGMN